MCLLWGTSGTLSFHLLVNAKVIKTYKLIDKAMIIKDIHDIVWEPLYKE